EALSSVVPCGWMKISAPQLSLDSQHLSDAPTFVVAIGAFNRLLDDVQSAISASGETKRPGVFAEKVQEMDAKIDATQAAQHLFQEVEAGREVATLHGQNAAEATAESVPEVPIVAHRQLDKIGDEFLNGMGAGA